MVIVFTSSPEAAAEAGVKIEVSSIVDTSSECTMSSVGQSARLNNGRGSWLRKLMSNTAVGSFLLSKLERFKQRRCDSKRRRITEKELRRLNRKIEKLLTTLDDPDVPTDIASVAEEEECVICLSAPAAIQSFPCAHRVTCRRCFVRTIQTAIAERSLPLRCVVCRSRILKLSDPLDTSALTAATATTLTNNVGGVAPREPIEKKDSPSSISALH